MSAVYGAKVRKETGTRPLLVMRVTVLIDARSDSRNARLELQ